MNLTDIHFELWLDDWEWEPFHGIHIEDDIDDMMEEWANEWAQPQEDEEQEEQEEQQEQEDNGPQEDEYAGIGGDHAWWLDEDEEDEDEDEDEDEADWNREQRMRGYV
jgi:segregation and condensation protein B